MRPVTPLYRDMGLSRAILHSLASKEWETTGSAELLADNHRPVDSSLVWSVDPMDPIICRRGTGVLP